MVPYSYNMVDMGGIDLAEANGTVVPGVYEKVVEAMNLCGDLILYNWKFAGINIAPSAYAVLQQDDSILINGLIQVTELDEVTVLGIEPPPPPIVPVSPLVVSENGVYEADPPSSGFNPVRVSVPAPTLVEGSSLMNGEFYPPEGAQGFSKFTVQVPAETQFNPIVGSVYVSASSQYDATHTAASAMGYKTENFWGGGSVNDQSIVFEFFEQVAISKVKFAPAFQQNNLHWYSETVTLQASNDGSTYETLETFSDLTDSNDQIEATLTPTPYKYYKFICRKSTTQQLYPGLGKIQFFI